jgi:NAD(P)-dependent dehydrogenase (short-subunit alcohol dehydrogenase family)
MTLQTKVAVVTGGATGIGNGIARSLAARGARVAIVQPTAAQAAEAALALPGAAGFAADIRDRDAVERMMAAVIERFGGIDILVNNASVTGLQALAEFATASPEHVHMVLDINIKGTVWCSQAAVRHMIATGRKGTIVHIASVGAFAGQENASMYCASKAAQSSLAQTMALELAPYGIRVNAVAPGDILTEANATIVTDLENVGGSGKYLRVTPLGRRGLPADIGDAVAFLVSDDARFITGTTLRVDGGFLSY